MVRHQHPLQILAGASVAAFVSLTSPMAMLDYVSAQGITVEQAVENARALEEGGFETEAEEYLRKAIDNNRELAAESLLLLEFARLASAPDEAVALADRVIDQEKDPALKGRAHVLKGDHLYALGLYMSAAREYRSAARLPVPDDLNALSTLREADSMLAGGDASRAAELYGMVVNLRPASVDILGWARLGLAQSLLDSGKPQVAAQRFEGIANDFGDREIGLLAVSGAARAHQDAGSYRAAIARLEQIVAEHPDTFQGVGAVETIEFLAARDTLGTSAANVSPVPSLIRVGSFSFRDGANQLKDRLEQAGLGPVCVTEKDGWIRVELGPYESRKEVNEVVERLRREEGIEDFLIVSQ